MSEFQPTCGDLTDSGNRSHLPRNIPRPSEFRGFLTPFKHPLHTNADPQERDLLVDRHRDRISQAGTSKSRGGNKVAHARKHDLRRPLQPELGPK